MNERIEKFKKHIEKHKVAYSCTATAIVFAGITFIIMRKPRAVLDYVGADCPDTEATGFLSLFSNKFNINSTITNSVVTVVERDGRGHPGYRIRNLDTLEEFDTQGLGARFYDIPEMVMSKHLRGEYPDAHGHHFERIAA